MIWDMSLPFLLATYPLLFILMRVESATSVFHTFFYLPCSSFILSVLAPLFSLRQEVISPLLAVGSIPSYLLTILSLVATYPSRNKIFDYARILAVASGMKKDESRKKDRLGALAWSRKYAKIRTADGRILTFKEAERDYQVKLLADTSLRIIVGKSRQLGISNTCAFIAAEEAIAGGTVLVVSKSLDQAALFLAYVYIALSDAPHPRFLKQNKYSLEFVGGGTIVCQSATKKAGRGIAATLAILDESAWQLYAREIFTAIVPTLSTVKGRLIVLSTPNGAGNLFQEQWDEALAQLHNLDPENRTWSAHFLPWWVNPEWDDAWAEAARADMGDKEFAQEHEVDFQGSGKNVFASDHIENLYKHAITYADPIQGHSYVNAFDLGRTRDAMAGYTIDISTIPFSVAHIEHHYRLDYTLQGALIDAIGTLYPGETLVESNGPGDPLIAFLNIPVIPFFTTALSKKNIIDSLQLLLAKSEIISPEHKATKLQLTRYIRRDQNIEQDLVMAFSIAAWRAGRPMRDSTVIAGGNRSPLTHAQIVEALGKMGKGGENILPGETATQPGYLAAPKNDFQLPPHGRV
jgi:hypothetical protein